MGNSGIIDNCIGLSNELNNLSFSILQLGRVAEIMLYLVITEAQKKK